MSEKQADIYRKNFTGNPDDNHCANCLHLGMCLGLRFSQPGHQPENASQHCAYFQLRPEQYPKEERK